MPVLPLVASMIVLSCVSAPRAIPSRIMAFAARSFTEPVGLKYSAFAYSSTPFSSRSIEGRRSKGVSPTMSNTVCPDFMSHLLLLNHDRYGCVLVQQKKELSSRGNEK